MRGESDVVDAENLRPGLSPAMRNDDAIRRVRQTIVNRRRSLSCTEDAHTSTRAVSRLSGGSIASEVELQAKLG
jgi:hypothetical protein